MRLLTLAAGVQVLVLLSAASGAVIEKMATEGIAIESKFASDAEGWTMDRGSFFYTNSEGGLCEYREQQSRKDGLVPYISPPNIRPTKPGSWYGDWRQITAIQIRLKSSGGRWFGRDVAPDPGVDTEPYVEMSSFLGDVFLENTQGSFGKFFYITDEVHAANTDGSTPSLGFVQYEIGINPEEDRVIGRWEFGGGANNMDQLLAYPISNFKIRMEYSYSSDLTVQLSQVALLGVMPDKVASSIRYAIYAGSGVLGAFICVGIHVFSRSERRAGRMPYERIRNRMFGAPKSDNEKLAEVMYNDPRAAGLGVPKDH